MWSKKKNVDAFLDYKHTLHSRRESGGYELNQRKSASSMVDRVSGFLRRLEIVVVGQAHSHGQRITMILGSPTR
jgi:hypothetical protein